MEQSQLNIRGEVWKVVCDIDDIKTAELAKHNKKRKEELARDG